MRNIYFKFIVKNNSILKDELMVNLSRKYYRHLKAVNAKFLVNGIEKRMHEEVMINDIIEIIGSEEEEQSTWPYLDMALDIRYENDNYLIVNKPHSLLTIPTKAEPRSLYQLINQYLGQKDVHILNRLDKETRGLVVIAKNRYAAYLLQPTHEHMERRYLCMVHGKVLKDGKISNYIEKIEGSNKRQITLNADKGKLAISNYKVIERHEDMTLLEFILETGRTHQIRLHSSNMGHPIIGDTKYGIEKEGELLLKSYRVTFVDPFSKEKIDVILDKEW